MSKGSVGRHRPHRFGTRARLVAAMSALALAAVACGSDDDEADASSDATTTTAGSTEETTAPSDGEPTPSDDVLRIAAHVFPPAGIDPIQVNVTDVEVMSVPIFSGLVSYDREAEEFSGDLAESFEVNADSTVYTFNLRQGVQFHHGYGEMTADDVVFSLNRSRSEESLWATTFENVASVEKIDDYTVEVTLTTPDSGFLFLMLNTRQGQIVSEDAVTELGPDFAFEPVGTGPFELISMDAASKRVVLERFDDYFGEPALLAGLDFTEIDQETAAVALESGELDLVVNIQGDTTLQGLEDAGFKLSFRPPVMLASVMNPIAQPAFADIRVRQAIAHAIDRETLIEAVAPVSEQAAINIVPPNFPEYTDDVETYEYDPVLARQLLEEAGYGDGLTIRRLVRGVDGIEDRDLLEQEMLAEIGITLEFDPVDPAQFSERRLNGDFEYATRSLSAATIDLLLRTILHPDFAPPNGFNGSYYDNPDVVALLNEGRSAPLGPERDAIYEELQQTVMADLPYIPETLLTQTWASVPNLEGIEFGFTGLTDMRTMYLAED